MKNKLLPFAAIATMAAAALTSMSSPVTAQTTTPLSEMEAERIFAAMDTNKDGRISRSEYATFQAIIFSPWNIGQSGILTREQIRTMEFERELRKSDGNPQGNSLIPGSVQKK